MQNKKYNKIGKKILFFVHGISFSPSTERRVMDYREYLLHSGIEPYFLSYSHPVIYRNFNTFSFEKQNIVFTFLYHIIRFHLGIGVILLRWMSLIKLLFYAKNFDVVFIQKVITPVWYVNILKKINPIIVFDFDDAIFLRKRRQAIAVIKQSRLVIAGSHYNLKFAEKYNNNSVFIPTPVPVNNFKNKENYDIKQDIVIGWIGSISTMPSLHIIRDVICKLVKEFPYINLRIIGFGNRKDLIPDFAGVKLDLISRIPYKTVPEVLINFDIGIMPLIYSEWDKGKCVGKALEYMACAVPCVIQRFGENIYAVKDGTNGFLADNAKEWYEKLSLLINEPQLRERIGKEGRKTVEKYYSTEVCAKMLLEKLLKMN